MPTCSGAWESAGSLDTSTAIEIADRGECLVAFDRSMDGIAVTPGLTRLNERAAKGE